MAIAPIARRFISSRIEAIVTAAGWTWTPPGGVAEPRLFYAVAPVGVPYPFVVFDELSPGVDVRTQNGSDVWSAPLWLVQAVDQEGETDEIESVVDGIDGVLHNTKGYVDGGRVVECWRESRHTQKDEAAGKVYVHLGTKYRMKIQEA